MDVELVIKVANLLIDTKTDHHDWIMWIEASSGHSMMVCFKRHFSSQRKTVALSVTLDMDGTYSFAAMRRAINQLERDFFRLIENDS